MNEKYSELIKDSTHSCVRVSAEGAKVVLSAWTNYNDTAELSPEGARLVARHLLAATDSAEGKPLSCAAKAEAYEPTFTLLGRDPAACVAISQWAQARIDHGLNALGDEQIQEALELSNAFEAYAQQRARKKSEGA